jgi:hypothetical protein
LQQWKTALKDAPNLWVERQKQFNVDGQMILEKAQKLSAEAK